MTEMLGFVFVYVFVGVCVSVCVYVSVRVCEQFLRTICCFLQEFSARVHMIHHFQTGTLRVSTFRLERQSPTDVFRDSIYRGSRPVYVNPLEPGLELSQHAQVCFTEYNLVDFYMSLSKCR